jgi:hypothetical protein
LNEKISKGDPNLEEKVKELIGVAQFYFARQDEFLRQVEQRKDPFWKYFLAFYKAYQKFGYTKVQSLFGQEFIFPSEIVAITSEWARSEHYSVVKSLKPKMSM